MVLSPCKSFFVILKIEGLLGPTLPAWPQGSKLPLLAKVLGKVKGTVTGGVVYWGEAPADAVKVRPHTNERAAARKV
jgi:hypothetical protein